MISEMATKYEFVCSGCSGLTFLATTRFPDACPLGHTQVQRKWGFGFVRTWSDPHFNQAVGKPVSNQAQFVDELKRASDAASEELGMEHRYLPMDPRDRDATRVTTEAPVEVKAGGWDDGPHRPPEE